jgi:taurine dioxygenase
MTFLKSIIRPDGCGDTQFADTVAAYQALPSEVQERFQSSTASYSYLKHRNVSESTGGTAGLTVEEVEAAAKAMTVHPVFTVHPITGEKNIYANPSHTVAIHGLSAEESQEMLQYLYDHVAKEEFLYTHVWQDHDFVMWDNRGKNVADVLKD